MLVDRLVKLMRLPPRQHPLNSFSRPCRLHVARLKRCFIEVWGGDGGVKWEKAEFSSRTHFCPIRLVPGRMVDLPNSNMSLLTGASSAFFMGYFSPLGQQRGPAAGHRGVNASLPLLPSSDLGQRRTPRALFPNALFPIQSCGDFKRS